MERERDSDNDCDRKLIMYLFHVNVDFAKEKSNLAITVIIHDEQLLQFLLSAKLGYIRIWKSSSNIISNF